MGIRCWLGFLAACFSIMLFATNGARADDVPSNRQYSPVIFYYGETAYGSASARVHYQNTQKWYLWSDQAAYCASMPVYQTTGWGYLISMSYVPATSPYVGGGLSANMYCVTPQPLPNGAIPMWFTYGFFWLCPEGYTRDYGHPNEHPRACYYDPPPPPVDPDQTPGIPDSPDATPPEPDIEAPAEPAPPEPLPLLPSPDSDQPMPGSDGGSGGSSTSCDGTVGDPINTAHGNKFDVITDYAVAGQSPLRFIRYYDSKMPASGRMGANWRHHYERHIETVSGTQVKLRRQDGKAYAFTLADGQWLTTGNVALRLQSSASGAGWHVTTAQGDTEYYDANGRLTQITARNGMSQSLAYANDGTLASVTDNHGRQLRFGHDTEGRLVTVTDPANHVYRYTYDVSGNLSTRQTPDGRTVTYLYENPSFPHALTGVVDGNGIRIDTTRYDSNGRAYSSETGNGADKLTIAYGENDAPSVTDASNVTHGYSYVLLQGVLKTTGMTRSCPTCGTVARHFERDAHGNIVSRTDYNGIRTTYQYDPVRHLEISRTEAAGTAEQRTVTTEWHLTLTVPVKITEPGRVTAMHYDSSGNMTTLSVTDASTQEVRTWSYAYGDFGLLASRTLPAGERIDYAYDANGWLTTATTSTGRVTRYADHDANGRVGKITYSSGKAVTFAYDEVGRVLARSETVVDSSRESANWLQQLLGWLLQLFGLGSPAVDAVGESGMAQTHYAYDASGLLTDITLPDGATLHYEYDASYRLILLRDALGNTVRIIRDPYGKPMETRVTDGAGTLARLVQRSHDALGRLAAVQGSNGQQLTQLYDEEGYLREQVNALGQRQSRQRDALYRTTALTDADSQTTGLEFDALDHLAAVTDARGNRTVYGRNAFGEAVTEQSPDRGTLVRGYEQGRLMQSTDARGITHSFAYDADGRLVRQAGPRATATYGYDEGEFGQGRLTSIDDPSGSTRYRYNSQGLVTEKTSLVHGTRLRVSYGYTLGGQLKEVVTPGQQRLQYRYDSAGRLSDVRVNGQPFLGQFQFGASGITGWTWANGDQRHEVRDLDGRITQITSGNALARSYGYDLANRLTSLQDSKAGINDLYSYDATGRLIRQQGAATTISYQYDAVGNRTQKQSQQGNSTTTTGYVHDPLSNRLLSETTGNKTTSYTYLPSGQISRAGTATYSYNDEGRLTEAKGSKTVRSRYNALGQRVRKQGSDTLLFAYDEAGRLLGEYLPGGLVVREYIWLGNRLVGLLSAQFPGVVLQVHTDHLGTPRAVSQNRTVLWRWEGEAFGNSQPNEQVAGLLRKLTLPLRFPGQYYDGETGLYYNYFRDYSPATGRYVQSDPIGLRGGVNTFGYAYASPLMGTDPLGLDTYSFAFGGNSTAGKGYGGQAGTFITTGGAAGDIDVGAFVTDSETVGMGGGIGFGFDYWTGGRETFDGQAVTNTLCVFGLCGSSHQDQSGNYIGWGVSIGGDSGGGTVPGGSFTHSNDTTRSVTARDLAERLRNWLGCD